MPKVTLEFEVPEDQSGLEAALDGDKWRAVAWDLDQWLRSQIKHSDRAPLILSVLQEVRDQLRDQVQETGLDFD